MTWKRFARANALLWLPTLTCAALAATVPGLAPVLRDAFAFELRPRTGSLDETVAIILANARVVATIFLLSLAARADRAHASSPTSSSRRSSSRT